MHDAFIEARARWRAADQRRERRKDREARKQREAAEKILANQGRGDRGRSNSSANARRYPGFNSQSARGNNSGYSGFNSRFARGRGGRNYYNK